MNTAAINNFPIMWSLPLRFFSLILIAVFCWLIEKHTEENISLAIVLIIGLPHYLFAYLYRQRSNGWEPTHYFYSISIFSLIIITSQYLPKEIFIGVVAAYFVIHFLLDEAYLSGDRVGLYGWLRIIPIVTIYWSYYACHLTNLDIWWGKTAINLSFIPVILWLLYALFINKKWMPIDWYYLSIYVTSYFFVYTGIQFQGKALFEPLHFLVICHVTNWYISHSLKLATQKKSIMPFAKEVFIVNTFSAILFIIYYALHNTDIIAASILGYLYQPVFFYAWTIVHFFSSLRKDDFRLSF